MQLGDISLTYVGISALESELNISLRKGFRKFAEWHKEFYI